MNHPFTSLPHGVTFDVTSREVFTPDAPAVAGESGAQTLARQLGCNVVLSGVYIQPRLVGDADLGLIP
jgi:hypothetical protein